MIIRIMTEGQYRVSNSLLDELNQIDNQLGDVVAQGDERAFGRLLSQILSMVREKGDLLPVEELVKSDVILPAPDTTLDQARDLFSEEGLIPG